MADKKTSEAIQPSESLNSTTMAVAWDLVKNRDYVTRQSSNPLPANFAEEEAVKTANLVRKVFEILVSGQKKE